MVIHTCTPRRKVRVPIVAAMAEGTATKDQLACVDLVTFPKNLPTDVKTAAIAHRDAFSRDGAVGDSA